MCGNIEKGAAFTFETAPLFHLPQPSLQYGVGGGFIAVSVLRTTSASIRLSA